MKRQRKKWESPRRPWEKEILVAELNLMGMYGLRNKKELWRTRYSLSRIRKIARGLLAKTEEERALAEKPLLSRMNRIGLLKKSATVDDVLDLTIEDLLERRLQTFVLRKGLAGTFQQARQLIVHGHIKVGDRRITSPSYMVRKQEEDSISYWDYSPLSKSDHPTRSEICLASTGA